MLWIKNGLNEKGLALPMVFLMAVAFVPLTIGLVFLSRQEGNIVRKSKVSVQADQLAEGAAHRGLVELKKRINEDLKENLYANYYAPDEIKAYTINPMNFIKDCLVNSASTDKFHIGETSATLTFTEALETGSYNTTIAISTTQAPVWDPGGGSTGNPTAHFYFKYQIMADSTVRNETNNDETSVLVVDSLSPNAVRSDGEFELKIKKLSLIRYNLFCDKREAYEYAALYRWESFMGPVHYNDELYFYGDIFDGSSAVFGDEVTSAIPRAFFYCHTTSGPTEMTGRLLGKDADFHDNGDGIPGPGDVRPTYNGGRPDRNVPRIELPSSVQMEGQQRVALGLARGVDIPDYADGVYVVNDGFNVNGGIYIQGDVNSLIMGTEGGGDHAVYTIDHIDGNEYTITVNMQSGRTEVKKGGATIGNYDGILNGVIFANDAEIRSLSGEVQENSQVTIAATNRITINDHIQYADNPLTNPDAVNVLGLVSWENHIIIGTSAPNDINIHASIMTPNGEFRVEDYRSCGLRGDLNLLGGVIGDSKPEHLRFNLRTGQITCGYRDQYVYDTRFKDGVAPPYFPTTDKFKIDAIDFNTAPSWRRQK
jgi:hypothetical protein